MLILRLSFITISTLLTMVSVILTHTYVAYRDACQSKQVMLALTFPKESQFIKPFVLYTI